MKKSNNGGQIKFRKRSCCWDRDNPHQSNSQFSRYLVRFQILNRIIAEFHWFILFQVLFQQSSATAASRYVAPYVAAAPALPNPTLSVVAPVYSAPVPIAGVYSLPQYHQTLTPVALESVKAAIANSEIEHGRILLLQGGQKAEGKIFLLVWLACLHSSNDYRLFCGDLGNEVNHDVLSKAFSQFPSFNMARRFCLKSRVVNVLCFSRMLVDPRSLLSGFIGIFKSSLQLVNQDSLSRGKISSVLLLFQNSNESKSEAPNQHAAGADFFIDDHVVRDKRTGKTEGYGFVSFPNPSDLASALKEMNGKYVGNRPIKLCKSKWNERTDFEALEKQKKQAQKKLKLSRKGVLHK
ncbi:hypothetical protein L6164_010624 [Bauhinia variegata]|uniref:Uncharacterized protein n=1 Tax=Bauhinia variegata TaxID=167791 RepID=A0ACB9PU56_BAUVA|nr:hypothetical protein L6164_010624 [Bauhinia variegata]